MNQTYERPKRILQRIIELQGENVMLINAIQRAQLLIVETKYDEADRILSDVIHRYLDAEAKSIAQR
jgi:hypothetical protein